MTYLFRFPTLSHMIQCDLLAYLQENYDQVGRHGQMIICNLFLEENAVKVLFKEKAHKRNFYLFLNKTINTNKIDDSQMEMLTYIATQTFTPHALVLEIFKLLVKECPTPLIKVVEKFKN